MEIFCKIINVFTVIFEQFNASLLNTSINFFKYLENFWTVVCHCELVWM